MARLELTLLEEGSKTEKGGVASIYACTTIHLQLTLKAPNKNLQQTTLIFLNFYLSKKIRLDVSCESSAKHRIHMKYHALFYQKNNEKIFKTAVCCSRDWRLKG